MRELWYKLLKIYIEKESILAGSLGIFFTDLIDLW